MSQRGYLLIADITGYTNVAGGRIATAPANPIVVSHGTVFFS